MIWLHHRLAKLPAAQDRSVKGDRPETLICQLGGFAHVMLSGCSWSESEILHYHYYCIFLAVKCGITCPFGCRALHCCAAKNIWTIA